MTTAKATTTKVHQLLGLTPLTVSMQQLESLHLAVCRFPAIDTAPEQQLSIILGPPPMGLSDAAAAATGASSLGD